MDKLDVLGELNKMQWHFAKTMKSIPHSYSRRREYGDYDKYCEIARYIKNEGSPERFFSKTYVYLRDGEYKYWIMDENPEDAEIINRAKIEPKAKMI